MRAYKTASGKYVGKASDELASMNRWELVSADEDIYVNGENKLVVSSTAPVGGLTLSGRPSVAHSNVNGEWVVSESSPELTFVDSNDNEIKYDVSDIDFLRVQQAQQAFALGAAKVRVKFTTGDTGVFTEGKLNELFKVAYQIKAQEYVVE